MKHQVRESERASRPKSIIDTCRTKACLFEEIKRHPDNLDAHWYLGQVYQTERDYPTAIKEFDFVIKMDSSFNGGYVLRDRANCKNNIRRDSSAVEDMNAAISFNPTERYFYLDRGTYFWNLQKYELALKDFDKAIELYNKFTEAIEWRAKTLAIINDKKNKATGK